MAVCFVWKDFFTVFCLVVSNSLLLKSCDFFKGVNKSLKFSIKDELEDSGYLHKPDELTIRANKIHIIKSDLTLHDRYSFFFMTIDSCLY